MTSPATPFVAIALQSGSSGNCIYIETQDGAVLIDGGIPARTVQDRLARFGRTPARIKALLITHDHGDHVRFAGTIHRKLGVPVFITEGSLHAARHRIALGAMSDLTCFRPGDSFRLGNLRVETIPTPHDGTDGVAFVIEHDQRRLGVMTDLGHVFGDLRASMRTLDAVYLESNYDPDLLAASSYPAHLKRRIRGPNGHLSNEEAAELIAKEASSRLRWVCLSHLSGQNNAPEAALATHRSILGPGLPLHVASRSEAGDLLVVG